MSLAALPPAAIGTVILAAALRGKPDAESFILAGCFYVFALIFVYGALAYAFGFADKSKIDPNYRPLHYWQRWPIGKNR
jgi:hypothetical protein